MALLRYGGFLGPAGAGVGPGLLRQRTAALAEELDEVVLDQLELLLPEQGQQIVTGIRGEIAGLIDRLEESGQLLVLGAPMDRERPHPVLEQSPRETLALVELVVDDLLLPHEVGLHHVEHQLVHRAQMGRNAIAQVLRRALVDRIVREVHVEGAKRFRQAVDQLRDLGGGEHVGRRLPAVMPSSPSRVGHVRHVLVAPAAEAHEHRSACRPSGRRSAVPRRARGRSRARE